MKSELRILHLEDNQDDAQLIRMLLEQHGIVCEMNWVQTREEFVAALEQPGWDVILSDFSLPAFNGLRALDLAREKQPEIPFLFVSGTLGEEVAIDALQSGATDYVLKDRLTRLVPAVRRAIAAADERQALKRAEASMIQSEFKYRQLFECLGEAALLADSESGRVLDSNRQAEVLFRRTRSQIVGTNVSALLSPPTLATYRSLVESGRAWDRAVFEGEALPSDAAPTPVAVSAASILLYNRQLVLGLYRDITGRQRVREELYHLKDKVQEYLAASPAEQKATSEPMAMVQTCIAALENALKSQWEISVPAPKGE